MSTISILHWISIGLLLLLIYGIYIFANRKPPAGESQGEASGVGGWLLLLILGFVLFGPIIGAGKLSSEFRSAEIQYPGLIALDKWATYQQATGWTHALLSAISIYAGILLARNRTPVAVFRAKVSLWVIGPIGSLIPGLILPLLIFGKAELDPEFLGALTVSAITSAIWTLYLIKSNRVRVTYGL